MKSRRRRASNSTRRFFERITFNLLGSKARLDQLEGRDHLVVPCVMIREGVHNGNHGPGLYRESETEPTVLDWNGMPVVVGHPKKETARSAKVLNSSGIGTVLNTDWDSKKRLTSELWLDVERTNEVDDRIIRAIEKKKKLEVSTGLFLNRQKKKGVFRGEDYEWIARNQKPDHLAILPDDIGACSVKKGCGILANSRKARKCKCGGSTQQEISMLSVKRKARMVRQLIANSGDWEESDKKALLAMQDSAFKKVYNAALESDEDDDTILDRKKIVKKKVKKVVKNRSEDREDDDADDTELEHRKKKKVVVNSADWWKSAPAEVRAVVKNGQKMIGRRKKALVEVIMNNENNVFKEKWLLNQEPDLLEGIAAIAQGSEEELDEDGMFVRDFRPDYSGAIGAAPTGNRKRKDDDDGDDDDDDEGLAAPELFPVENEESESKKKKASKLRV